MYNLAVFDLDGTLLDTIDDLANACNYALAQSGFPLHDREAYKRFVGDGVHNLILRAIAPNSDAASTRKVEAAFRAYYTAHAQECTRPYDGVAEMLEKLRAAGAAVAVLTNKPHENAKALVAAYFPGLVDWVYGQREGVPIKPDPTALLAILERFGVLREACAYLGDSGVDMQTGVAAGVAAIGVTWGFRTRNELELAGASVIVDKPCDLLTILIDKS